MASLSVRERDDDMPSRLRSRAAKHGVSMGVPDGQIAAIAIACLDHLVLVTRTVDVAFGDALEPGAVVIDYGCTLDLPAPRLPTYARETVIAEKLQAMVALGRANSRMQDFHDIWLLIQSFSFDHDRLARAIAAAKISRSR